MKTKQEIIKGLEQIIEDYNKEFSDDFITKEKYGLACVVKGFITALKWVLEIDEVEKDYVDTILTPKRKEQ